MSTQEVNSLKAPIKCFQSRHLFPSMEVQMRYYSLSLSLVIIYVNINFCIIIVQLASYLQTHLRK